MNLLISLILLIERKRIKNKLKFMGKMMKFNKVLREESENVVKLKGMCPDNKIPMGLLT